MSVCMHMCMYESMVIERRKVGKQRQRERESEGELKEKAKKRGVPYPNSL